MSSKDSEQNNVFKRFRTEQCHQKIQNRTMFSKDSEQNDVIKRFVTEQCQQKNQNDIELILRCEEFAEFLGLMAVSILALLHHHFPHFLWCYLIETDHYKPIIDHYDRRIFYVFRFGISVPRYFDQYN
ncbi:hypothetical protein AVEN_88790-1 [Araneus ventricosus]|uniref:Uncharacterized protein n=1 Tax=Araneus ventricosus TaxID=182803 RepID=A0A4Y2SFB4_ARAVE|nr:hypothetical protein AVEN_88790-1 [Araneus ventricosus]